MPRRSYAYEDRKNMLAYIITAILVVLTVICGFFIHYLSMQGGGGESAPVLVAVDGVTVNADEALPLDDMQLSPGSSVQYVLSVTTLQAGEHTVTLRFTRENDFTRNVGFVSVVITDGLQTLVQSDLQSVLAGKDVTFTHAAGMNVAQNYTVIYSIPDSVGNEAQNLDLRFDVEIITAKK